VKGAALTVGLAVLTRSSAGGGDWGAPAEVRGRTNPLEITSGVLARGQALYVRHCALCHGDKGKGDGPAAPFNSKKPRSLADSQRQKELTDGEIFWKISTGRKEGETVLMPSFAEKIEAEEDRWSLVVFVRALAPPPRARKTP
jgi:mono/diheme cytochrome c family protein